MLKVLELVLMLELVLALVLLLLLKDDGSSSCRNERLVVNSRSRSLHGKKTAFHDVVDVDFEMVEISVAGIVRVVGDAIAVFVKTIVAAIL